MKITKKQLKEMVKREAKRQLKLQENKALFGEWQYLIDKLHEQGMSDEAILHDLIVSLPMSDEAILYDLITSLPKKELKPALKSVARMNGVEYP